MIERKRQQRMTWRRNQSTLRWGAQICRNPFEQCIKGPWLVVCCFLGWGGGILRLYKGYNNIGIYRIVYREF